MSRLSPDEMKANFLKGFGIEFPLALTQSTSISSLICLVRIQFIWLLAETLPRYFSIDMPLLVLLFFCLNLN